MRRAKTKPQSRIQSRSHIDPWIRPSAGPRPGTGPDVAKAELDARGLAPGTRCVSCGTRLHRLLLEAGQRWHDGECDPTPLPTSTRPPLAIVRDQLDVDVTGDQPDE